MFDVVLLHASVCCTSGFCSAVTGAISASSCLCLAFRCVIRLLMLYEPFVPPIDSLEDQFAVLYALDFIVKSEVFTLLTFCPIYFAR